MVGDQGALHAGWRHGYAKKLILYQYNPGQVAIYTWTAYPGGKGRWSEQWGLTPETPGAYTASIHNPDGYGYFFSSSDGNTWVADADVKARLSATRNGTEFAQFNLLLPSGDTEIYDASGRLMEIRYRHGNILTLTYSWVPMDSGTPAYLPTGVGNSYGQALHLDYNGQGRLIGMTDPAGNLYQYEYGPNGLAAVTYPGGGRRQYLYNEAALVAGASAAWTLLTGIADEVTPGNVVRYGTYAYDVQGRPVSTSHPNDVDKYTFNYTNNTVTDPLGAQRSYGFGTTARNRLVQTGISQTFGSTKVWAEESYDANGNLKSSYDFKGVRTWRTFDQIRNLELTRVDGLDTPAYARTTTTSWHENYALPLKVAEPRRITTYTYDATGNALTRTVQATTDASGAQGLTGAVTGSPRTWTYTYNALGQVLTAKGPRTDVNDTTTYTYDAQGNLASVTNALGHVTTLSNYDAHGRAGRITDPNGRITDVNYTARGWLSSTTTGSATTSYTYDYVGQLTRVTLPDGSTVNYGYDEARRLVTVSDALGNSIGYTLDKLGNRTGEDVRDVGGTLARQVARVFDNLGRLQQQTGGMQ